MGFELKLGDLASREIRKNTVGEDKGIRRIAISALGEKKDKDGNVLSRSWDATKRFGASLLAKVWGTLVSGVSITFSFLWSKIVSTVQFIWNFNWNTSDEELDKSLESQWNQLGGSLGGTLGSALGFAVCGGGAGLVIGTFNEALALKVYEEVGEEALDEISANLANVLSQSANIVGKYIFNTIYKNSRRALDVLLDGQLANLEDSGQISNETVANIRKEREEERKKPWSFASKFEDAVESIPNQFIQNFIEELFEEGTEACIEAGYIVANTLDSHYIENQMANKRSLGAERTVEIDFNRDDDSDSANGSGSGGPQITIIR